jgi:putative transposase
MAESKVHRKTVRHYDEPGHVHELTFSCYQRRPLLTNDRWRTMLGEAVDRAHERHRYRLVAYVFMPEHVHLLTFAEADASKVSDLLRAIKRPFSYRIKQLLTEANSPLLDGLTVRQRPGVQAFRFWQEGGGYDRNLTEAETIGAAIDYIHMNPVRRGLVPLTNEWRWSSASFYIDGEQQTPPTVDALPWEHTE